MGGVNSKQLLKDLVERLNRERVAAGDGEFWNSFFEHVVAIDDVFDLIHFHHVGILRSSQPANLAVLLYKAVEEIDRVSQLPSPSDTDTTKATCAIRLLTRLMPPLFAGDKTDGLSETIFWTKGQLDTTIIRPPSPSHPTQQQQQQQKVPTSVSKPPPATEQTPTTDTATPTPTKPTKPTPDQTTTTKTKKSEEPEEEIGDILQLPSGPLAVVLMRALPRLMFLPGFSVPAATAKSDKNAAKCLWAPGTGPYEAKAPTAAMLHRRTELLLCTLACVSSPLYSPTDQPASCKWLRALAHPSVPRSEELFYSLINVSCGYDPVGWGLPYNHVFFADEQEKLTDSSLQLLCLLLLEEGGDNKHLDLLRDMDDKQWFSYIFRSLEKLIINPLNASNTYLPNSAKTVSSHQEMLTLFWRLCLENERFLEHVVRTEEMSSVTVAILYFILEGRKDEANIGLIHLCTFLLLVLSGERAFSIQLNKPFVRAKYAEVPLFTGNIADFLVLVVHKVLTDSSPKLSGLHESFLTIVDNISGYVKSLCMVSAMALLRLMERYSRPKFLFAGPQNFSFCFFLLETFNNLIQYQYEGNSRLVYAILRKRDVFAKLANVCWEDRNPQTKQNTTADPFGKAVQDKQASQKQEDTATTTTATTTTNTTTNSKVAPEQQQQQPTQQQQQQPQQPVFTPTVDWFDSWKAEMPISTILRLIGAVLPDLPPLIHGSAADESQILQYLQSTTLVGLLPVPHPILIRRYQHTEPTKLWLHRYLWGVLYVRNRSPPLFGGPTDVTMWRMLPRKEK